MADQQDEKHPYKSRFAHNLWVRPDQYLAENMVARLATRDRYQLPDRFWAKSDKWAKEFRLQAIKAAALLKEYSIEAIIAALRTTRGKKVYSFGAKSILVPLIKDEQERLDRQKQLSQMNPAAEPEPDPTPAAPAAPRPAFVPDNTLSKLRDL